MNIAETRDLVDPTAGGALLPRPASAAPLNRAILLLDYSGSMYGGYGAEPPPGCPQCRAGLSRAGQPARNGQPYYFGTPEFSAWAADWLHAATAGAPLNVEILLFNRQLWHAAEGRVEPFTDGVALAFTGDAEAAAATVRALPRSPYEVDPQAPDRTDMAKALATATAALGGEGVIWLVTDNLADSTGGVVDEADSASNVAFYEALRGDPRAQLVDAYPVHASEACSWLCGTALFVYGIYVSPYERSPQRELAHIGGTDDGAGGPTAAGLVWNQELQTIAATYSGPASADKPLAGVPLRLKPTDANVLSFDFERHGEEALVCTRDAQYGEAIRCRATAVIRNVLRHQVVQHAELRFSNGVMAPFTDRNSSVEWASPVCPDTIKVLSWQIHDGASGKGDAPISLGPIPPLGTATIDLVLSLPPVVVAPRSLREALEIAFTGEIALRGELLANVKDVRTQLSIPTEQLADVYGAAELPAIFRGEATSELGAAYGVRAVVRNDGQILGLVVVVGSVVFLAAVSLVLIRFQRAHYLVEVEGAVAEKKSMPRWSGRPIKVDGVHAATMRRGWGSDVTLSAAPGWRVRRDGAAWKLSLRDSDEDRRVEVRRVSGGVGFDEKRRETTF